MNPILTMLIALSLSYLGSTSLEKHGLPRFLSPILVGIVFTLEPLHSYLFDKITLDLFTTLSNIGLILLLFYVGLSFDYQNFAKSKNTTLTIAAIATFIPLVLSFLIILLLGLTIVQSFVISLSITFTAESVALTMLKENNLLSHKIGNMIIGAGILDDFLEILGMAMVSSILIAKTSMFSSGMLIKYGALIGFTLMFFAFKYVFLSSIREFLSQKGSFARYDLFTASIIFVLALSLLTEYFDLGFAIGAFLAGILVRLAFEKQKKPLKKNNLNDMIDLFSFGFLSYFFFIVIGLHTNVLDIFMNMQLGLILVFLAIGTKWGSSVLAILKVKEKFWEGNLVGWGLNAKGAMDLVIAQLAMESHIISEKLFSSIVFMSVTVMVIAPLMFNFFAKRYHEKIIQTEKA